MGARCQASHDKQDESHISYLIATQTLGGESDEIVDRGEVFDRCDDTVGEFEGEFVGSSGLGGVGSLRWEQPDAASYHPEVSSQDFDVDRVQSPSFSHGNWVVDQGDLAEYGIERQPVARGMPPVGDALLPRPPLAHPDGLARRYAQVVSFQDTQSPRDADTVPDTVRDDNKALPGLAERPLFRQLVPGTFRATGNPVRTLSDAARSTCAAGSLARNDTLGGVSDKTPGDASSTVRQVRVGPPPQVPRGIPGFQCRPTLRRVPDNVPNNIRPTWPAPRGPTSGRPAPVGPTFNRPAPEGPRYHDAGYQDTNFNCYQDTSYQDTSYQDNRYRDTQERTFGSGRVDGHARPPSRPAVGTQFQTAAPPTGWYDDQGHRPDLSHWSINQGPWMEPRTRQAPQEDPWRGHPYGAPPPGHQAARTTPGFQPGYWTSPQEGFVTGFSTRNPPHVDPRHIQSAIQGEFVHLENFLDNTTNDYEEVGNYDANVRASRPRRCITNMFKWMEAWGHYEVVLVAHYGEELYFELAKYRSFLISLTRKYKVPFILTYDERNRAALGRFRSFNFATFDNQLFVTIFDANSLRAVTRCPRCASVDHGVVDCPFRGTAPQGAKSQSSQSSQSNPEKGKPKSPVDPNEVCIRYQDGTCRYKGNSCPRKHCCYICGGPAGAKSCAKCGGGSKGPLS